MRGARRPSPIIFARRFSDQRFMLPLFLANLCVSFAPFVDVLASTTSGEFEFEDSHVLDSHLNSFEIVRTLRIRCDRLSPKMLCVWPWRRLSRQSSVQQGEDKILSAIEYSRSKHSDDAAFFLRRP